MEIPKMFVIDRKVFNRPPKRQGFTVVLQSFQKSAAKYSIEKSMLLEFRGFVYNVFYKVVVKKLYFFLTNLA